MANEICFSNLVEHRLLKTCIDVLKSSVHEWLIFLITLVKIQMISYLYLYKFMFLC